jgi:hypothetical protein
LFAGAADGGAGGVITLAEPVGGVYSSAGVV